MAEITPAVKTLDLRAEAARNQKQTICQATKEGKLNIALYQNVSETIKFI